MVRDAILAIAALAVTVIAAAVILPAWSMLLALLSSDAGNPHHLLFGLWAVPWLAVWASAAWLIERLSGCWLTALFRTSIAAFPVLVGATLTLREAHLVVLAAAAAAPMLAAGLAHATRSGLIHHGAGGKPIVSKDDRNRAILAHVMGAVAGLCLLSGCWSIGGRLGAMLARATTYTFTPAQLAVRVEVEQWIWLAGVMLLLLTMALLATAALVEDRAGAEQWAAIEGGAWHVTIALVMCTVFGWLLGAVGWAYAIGPWVLLAVLALTAVALGILFCRDLTRLLERWQQRLGGNAWLDAGGCALLLAAAVALSWATIAMAIVWPGLPATLPMLLSILTLVAGAALTAAYVDAAEHEQLSFIVARGLGAAVAAALVVLQILAAPSPGWREREPVLSRLIVWCLLVIAIIAIRACERRGAFAAWTGEEPATRNSRVDDGNAGDRMRRD